MSSAQLAARFPQSGGTPEYGYRVIHPAAGFAAGWMFLASKLDAAGTVALGSVGADALAASRSPLERGAESFSGPGLGRFLAVGAATAMFGPCSARSSVSAA